jgi:RNA-splicing ligase RtcB
LSVDEFERQMDGIYSTSVSRKTLDESPMAYKPIDNILNNVEETVKIMEIVKPVYNFKAK